MQEETIRAYITTLPKEKKHNRRRETYPTNEPCGVLFIEKNSPWNTALLPTDTARPTPKPLGEIIAAIRAALVCPTDAPLYIISSRPNLRNAITEKLANWEDKGWLGVPHAEYLRALIGILRNRCAPTYFELGKSEQQKGIFKEARKIGREKRRDGHTVLIHPIAPQNFVLSGMRLSCITQSNAYKGIINLKKHAPRQSMTRNMQQIKTKIREEGIRIPHENQVWAHIRHSDIQLRISDFLWKLIQGALKIGSYWDNIPGYEDRMMCTPCICTESAEHIFLHCNAPGQNQLWSLAKKTWEHTGCTWPNLSVESLILCATRSWKAPFCSQDPRGLTRLWRIIISETMHLIWIIRCERVIKHENDPQKFHTTKELTARWVKRINNRIAIDKAMTKPRPPLSNLQPELVKSTWQTIIDVPEEHKSDWHKKSWVLVGIAKVIYAVDDD